MASLRLLALPDQRAVRNPDSLQKQLDSLIWRFFGSTPITPARPRHTFPGAVHVFWTWPADGVVLDEVSAITSSPITGWSLVPTVTYQTNATHVSITISMPTGMRVYRLRRL